MNLDEVIRVETIAEHVTAITLNRPEQGNTITVEMMRRLAEHCTRLEDDKATRVIVLRGAGPRFFCAGADLGSVDLSKRPGGDPPADFRRDGYVPLIRLSKPLIGAINGAAAGGGLGLALCCDTRIAADNAVFATAFGRIGIPVHDNVAWLLPRVVGVPQALRLVYRPKPMKADEALRIGLVEEVVPAAQLEARTIELASEIATLAPYATQLSKRLVLEAGHRTIEEHMLAQEYAALANQAIASNDIDEGMKAFAEKRAPKFRGPQ
jgi:2-(1,2-epoxy-1,2-dihydrophenyl)acetyl-CoA isomerase